MANKFFSYSFQVSRAKKAGIVLIIFIIILGTISFLWYRSKNNITKLDDLKYKVVFGMNEFEDGSCDKAYKINYNKNTCGSICIKKLNKDNDYIKNTKSQLETNGFTIKNINNKKINNKNWEYFSTSNDGPIISYYANNSTDKTYVIEKIDQSYYLNNKTKSKCSEIFNKTMGSLKINE